MTPLTNPHKPCVSSVKKGQAACLVPHTTRPAQLHTTPPCRGNDRQTHCTDWRQPIERTNRQTRRQRKSSFPRQQPRSTGRVLVQGECRAGRGIRTVKSTRGSQLAANWEPWEVEYRDGCSRWLQSTVGPPRVLDDCALATMHISSAHEWKLAWDRGDWGPGEQQSSLKLCLFCDDLQSPVVEAGGTAGAGAHLKMIVLILVCVFRSPAPSKHRPCSVHRGW